MANRYVYTPEGGIEMPWTPQAVILNALLVIDETPTRWTIRQDFKFLDQGHEDTKENPFSQGADWCCCARGALGIVSVGLVNLSHDCGSPYCWQRDMGWRVAGYSEDPVDKRTLDVYHESLRHLNSVTRDLHGTNLTHYNDHLPPDRGREVILSLFNEARERLH